MLWRVCHVLLGCGDTQNAEVDCYFLGLVGGHGGNVSASVLLFKLSNFSVKIQLTISPSPKTPPTNATHTHTSTHKGERCCLASPIALDYKAFEYTPSRRPLRASEAHLTLRRISPTCGWCKMRLRGSQLHLAEALSFTSQRLSGASSWQV